MKNFAATADQVEGVAFVLVEAADKDVAAGHGHHAAALLLSVERQLEYQSFVKENFVGVGDEQASSGPFAVSAKARNILSDELDKGGFWGIKFQEIELLLQIKDIEAAFAITILE